MRRRIALCTAALLTLAACAKHEQIANTTDTTANSDLTATGDNLTSDNALDAGDNAVGADGGNASNRL